MRHINEITMTGVGHPPAAVTGTAVGGTVIVGGQYDPTLGSVLTVGANAAGAAVSGILNTSPDGEAWHPVATAVAGTAANVVTMHPVTIAEPYLRLDLVVTGGTATVGAVLATKPLA